MTRQFVSNAIKKIFPIPPLQCCIIGVNVGITAACIIYSFFKLLNFRLNYKRKMQTYTLHLTAITQSKINKKAKKKNEK